jgi:hypothetical protein
MRLKEGVQIGVLTPQLVLAAIIVESVYQRGSLDPVITSCNDGEHHGQPVKGDSKDPHYMGKAFDIRLWEIHPENRQGVLDSLREALGDNYVVLWENVGEPNEHYHVQWGYVG